MPVEERRDDPLRRSLADRAALDLVNTFVFQGLLEDSIQHASVTCPADPAAQHWIPLGPRNIGGRIRALAQHPRNPLVLYAGSAFGGVWKTENGGDTWTPLDDFRPPAGAVAVHRALPVGAIAVAQSNPLIVYVGTGEPVVGDYPGSGLYRSSNGGTTFFLIDHVHTGVIQADRYERIQVDPWNADRCWMACPKGLWRREPGGAITQDVIDAAGAPVAASQDATDVVIDFGNRDAAAAPATFTVYAALRGQGIYRATFTTATHTYTAVAGTHWTKLASGIDEGEVRRVKLALCQRHPEHVYAIFGLHDESASRVYHSNNRGDRWTKTGERAGDDSTQSWYSLLLDVHPDFPNILFMGAVNLFRSMDGGQHWQMVIDWRQYDNGNDRAQHADEHAFLFDVGDPRKIWVGNDGGVSMSRNLGQSWRKRSHGILACQFYDVTAHPTYPFITGGGLQDNGTWVGFGGPSWYRLSGGDGGGMGFEPASAQQFTVTWQGTGDATATDGVVGCTVRNTEASGGFQNLTPLPDVSTKLPMKKFFPEQTDLTDGFDGANHQVFGGVLEHHPTTANHMMVARKGAAYLTTDGNRFAKLNTGAFTPADAEVSALAYAPSSPATDWWIGTSRGEVFVTTDAGVTFRKIALPGIGAAFITDIAVHPANASIVAVSTAHRPGRVYLSGDKGVHWYELSGRAIVGVAGAAAPAADQMSPSPVTCIAFDPRTLPGVGDNQTLFAGTLAGIYIIRNGRAATAAAVPGGWAPQWRTFNVDLPLLLVYDIVPVVVRNAAAAVVRNLLRCATLGRGMYQCDLAGVPRVRLLVRDTAIDDGYTYEGAAVLANDPRLVPATAFVQDRAFDVRVDSGEFYFFEDTVDGVEFDEELMSQDVVAGERNLIYVQVQNTGWGAAADVKVHLYWANAAGAPPVAPNLPAGFWGTLAGAPPAGPWRRVAPAQSAAIRPGNPVVLRFEWVAPADVTNPVCLLACCTHADDNLAAPAPSLTVNPGAPHSVVVEERRVALRTAAVVPLSDAIYVRDAVTDQGSPGAVAWGARSTDIVVRPAAEATPDVTFADLADLRPGDRVKGGKKNYIYVRVHNRSSLVIDAEVDLYRIPFATPHQPATWTKLDTKAVAGIREKNWKFAPAIEWNNPPDPDPAPENPYKVYLLAAIIGRPGEPKPATAGITDLTTFWRFFVRDASENNVALRALRWEP